MNHLKQAINLFGQKYPSTMRYNPSYDRHQIEKLKDQLNEITDGGEKTEDDLTSEELLDIYEIEEAIEQHERNIKTKGKDYF